MNKKGVMELNYIISILVGLVISAFVASFLYQQFNIKLGEKYDDNAMNIYHKVLPAITIQNWTIVIFFISSLIATVISASRIRTHPIYFIASFIVFLVTCAIIAPTASNLFDQLMNNTNLQQFESLYFPETSHLMNHLPFYIAIGGAMILVAYFAKSILEG